MTMVRSVSRKRLIFAYVLVSFLLASLGTTLLTAPGFVAKASNGTLLSVIPPLRTSDPGGLSFYLYANLSGGVTDLYTYAFSLRWERGLLECTNVLEYTTFFDGDFSPIVHDDGVDVGSSLTGAVPGVTGEGGILCRFTMRAIGAGNCTLALEDTLLLNTESAPGNEIPHSVSDGYFYTTVPRARYTFSPDPRDQYHPEYEGHPIVNETVTFDASSSYDPDQSYRGQTGTGISWYSWAFGDYEYNFTDSPIVTHNYSQPGIYLVTLTVEDDDFQTSPEFHYPDAGLRIQHHDVSVVEVVVTNDPPIVQVGGKAFMNVTVVNQGTEPEYLNVTAYANGQPVNTTQFVYYEWREFEQRWVARYSLQPGENATGQVIWDTTGFADGDYTMSVNLTLVKQVNLVWVSYDHLETDFSDNYLVDGSVTVSPLGYEIYNVAVQSAGISPVNLKIDEWAYVTVQVKSKSNIDQQFNATVIVLYPNSTVCKTWNYVNRTLAAGATAYLGAPVPLSLFKGSATLPEGNYNLTVIMVIVNATTLEEITDEDPSDNMVTKQILIRMRPWAAFSYSPSSALIGQLVTFNATASYAPGSPGGTIVKYSWTFADGYSFESTGPIAKHAFDRVGTFAVKLQVTDDVGLTGNVTASPSVPVRAFHNVAVSAAELSDTRVTVGDVVSIDVTVENSGYYAETANVTVLYDAEVLGLEINKTLAIGAESLLTFSWDTTDVPMGDYDIIAMISELSEEIDFSDNILIVGTVTVEGVESSISVEVSSASLKLGESTTISGAIDPQRVGASVTIWVKLVDGDWTILERPNTGAAGAYSHAWTPEAEGYYVVYSSWAGDDFALPSESDMMVVMVVAEPPPPPIDVFMISTAALAVLWLVTLAYFLVLKKPK